MIKAVKSCQRRPGRASALRRRARPYESPVVPGTPPPPTARARDWLAAVPVLLLAVWVFAPFFADVRTMGFQDWDSQAAYRYVTVLALRHGQPPWWNPWFCGGFPAWGYAEGATNFISPFAPLYFLFSFPLALRLEALAATLVAVLGAFLLAGRFTRSPAWRALVGAMWILGSRWALQVASGHLWHLAYAWTPFAFYFFDRAVAERRFALGGAAGAMLALMIYVGGIYPYPQTVLVLWLFAIGMAAATRSPRPLRTMVVAVFTSFGLAAPKLLPVLATMRRFPRLIESDEAISLGSLWTMLTAHQQGFDFYPHLPLRVFWVWWEWGAYVGVAGGLALAAALAVGWSPRLVALKVAALVCVVLALGQGIWTALHRLPVFSSQHLPSRILFLAILLLALVLAAAADAPWARWTGRHRWAELAGLGVVCLYGLDLAAVSRQATVAPFKLQVPDVPPAATFRQERFQHYRYRRPVVPDAIRDRYEWPAKIIYPSMLANTGMVTCYGVPLEFKSTVVGADQPGYPGLVFLTGAGQAALVGWSPNALTVHVTGAGAGERVVYDTSFDPGWRVNGRAAEDRQGLVAGAVAPGESTVEIRYRPVGLVPGLALFALTLAVWGGALVWQRRRRPLT
jgi:hypothetical protein